MRQNIRRPFRQKIMEMGHVGTLKTGSDKVYIFNVHAAYGHYQIFLSTKGHLEISGAMHHLFVSRDHITPHPSKKQIQNNLKGIILLRDLLIHLDDPTGAGRTLSPQAKKNGVLVKEKINMAGEEGLRQLQRMQLSGRLAKETYKIVQEDILNAFINKQFTVSS